VRFANKELVEFIWARCIVCKKIVGEVRVLEADNAHLLKRVLRVSDMINAQNTRGLCCVEFQTHLQVNEKIYFLHILEIEFNFKINKAITE